MKIEKSLYYHNTIYLYTIYFSPLGNYRDEVIRIFGNRLQNGKRCLGINEEYSKYIIDNNQSSIFIIVHEKGTMDYASASLSIENRCFDKKEEPQVFVMELCRHGEKSSVISPVKVLFDVAEHVVKQKLNKKYLYLNPQPGEGFERLIDIYTKYGFEKTFCPKLKYYTMRKRISNRRTKRK